MVTLMIETLTYGSNPLFSCTCVQSLYFLILNRAFGHWTRGACSLTKVKISEVLRLKHHPANHI